jgi:hypothetical protein
VVAVVGFLAVVGLVGLVSRLDLRGDRYVDRALS